MTTQDVAGTGPLPGGRRRRVLFTLRILDSGGVPTHMMTLAEGLRALGWDVAVASHGQQGQHAHGPSWFESNGFRHYLVPFPGPGSNTRALINTARSFRALNAVVRDFQPDLLHVHFRATSLHARAIQWMHGIPFVASLLADRIPAGPGYRLATFWGSRTIAISNETRTHLVDKFGVSEDRLRTIYLGSDQRRFRPPSAQQRADARTTYGVPLDGDVVTLIGRFDPIKRHDLLITALASLRADGREVHAIFAGEGGLERQVKQQAIDSGVGDLVHFVGYTDARDVLWASDVCVLPSDSEGFPCVVVEAMLSGTVCIRTPAGGAADQINDGEDCFIVPFGDAVALAGRLSELFQDEDLRAKLADAALLRALSYFTQETMVARTVEVYEEALATARPKKPKPSSAATESGGPVAVVSGVGRRVMFTLRILDSGGVPTHMMSLATGLRAAGWEVAVASHGQVGEHAHGPAWFEQHGIRHFQVPFPGPASPLVAVVDTFRAARALRAAVADFRPDLLHVHFRATSAHARWLQLTTGVPFVASLHLERIPAGVAHRLATFWGSRSIAISSETRACLVDTFKVAPSRVRTVYNGVDSNRFRPPTAEERAAARDRYSIPPAAFAVAMISRFESVKRHDVLICALDVLRKSGVEAHAMLAGEGRLQEAVRTQAVDLGVDDLVHFVGYTDARDVLWAADACVLPSDVEGFPCVIVEAMLAGVVSVRTPSGGAGDQMDDGRHGFVVPFGDPQALADRLALLHRDPERRADISHAAFERAKKCFTQEAMVDQTIAVYEEALAESARG